MMARQSRVAVLSARPCTVRAVVDVDLPDRSSGTDVRSTPQFAHHRHEIWSLLRGGENAHGDTQSATAHAKNSGEVVPVG